MDQTSKAAKKNAKKREKKKEANLKEKIANSKQTTIEKEVDPVSRIKAELAEAKANGNSKLAAKLRQDLWILQDVNSGIDPVLDDKKAIDESLERLANHVPEKVLIKNDIFKEESKNVSQSSSLLPHEKELKKLNKKLRDIESLKKKQSEGTVLEKTQLDKVLKEESILEEIRQIEEMMSTVKTL